MKFCYALFAVLVTVTLVTAKAATQVGPPPDHTIECLAWEPKTLTLVDTITQNPLAVAAAGEQFSQPAPKGKDDYSIAYEAAQACGKLCIYVGMDGCPHCPGAAKVFEECATKSAGACIMLDKDGDKYYADELAKEHGQGSGCPQVVVYRKSGGDWTRSVVIGNKPDAIRHAMLDSTDTGAVESDAASPGSAVTLASYHPGNHEHPHACPGGCANCPGDCAANGCHCHSAASGHGAGSCGAAGDWHVPGQPARNLIRGTGKLLQRTCEVVRNSWPRWPATGNPVGWRLRPRNWRR